MKAKKRGRAGAKFALTGPERNVIERDMAKRGYVRVPNGSGSEHANIVGVLAYRGVKLVRHAGVTWAPRLELHASQTSRLKPNDVKGWTKTKIIEYAKDLGHAVSEHMVHGARGGESLRVDIGAGTGTSYRSALMDLLGYEERERWRKAALELGLSGDLGKGFVGKSGDSSTEIMRKSALLAEEFTGIEKVPKSVVLGKNHYGRKSFADVTPLGIFRIAEEKNPDSNEIHSVMLGQESAVLLRDWLDLHLPKASQTGAEFAASRLTREESDVSMNRTGKKVTVVTVQHDVLKVSKAAHDGDDEKAHSLEDDLHLSVLEAIAEGRCESPVSCAREASKTKNIRFARHAA